MSVIKTENLDVYALIERNAFIVSVLLDNETIATFEYPIEDLAKDVVASLSNEDGIITGEDAEEAYDMIEALDNAYMYINERIKD